MEEKIPKRKEIQVHIIAGCSDSRDISDAFNHAKDKRVEYEKKNGRLIDIQRPSVPGVFATPEIIGEIKTLIFRKMSDYYAHIVERKKPIEFFVHMTSHGAARLKEGRTYGAFSYQDIEVDTRETVAFNCGMTKAKKVMGDFEELLIAEKPYLEWGINEKRQRIQIKSESDLEHVMKLAHNWDGTPASNWVQPVTKIETHPYEQKKILRRAIDGDRDLKHLQVHITAGVQNYETNEYYRVDGNVHLKTVFDEIYEDIRHNGKSSEDHKNRTLKQKPSILLFHHSGINNARAIAVRTIYGDEKGTAGEVFAIAGANAHDHTRLYPWTKVTGGAMSLMEEYFSIKQVGSFGRTEQEAMQIYSRMCQDPFIGFMLRYFKPKVELLAVDPRQTFPHTRNENGSYVGTAKRVAIK